MLSAGQALYLGAKMKSCWFPQPLEPEMTQGWSQLSWRPLQSSPRGETLPPPSFDRGAAGEETRESLAIPSLSLLIRSRDQLSLLSRQAWYLPMPNHHFHCHQFRILKTRNWPQPKRISHLLGLILEQHCFKRFPRNRKATSVRDESQPLTATWSFPPPASMEPAKPRRVFPTARTGGEIVRTQIDFWLDMACF